MDLQALVTSLLQHPLTPFVLALLITNLVTGLLVAVWPTTREKFTLGSVGDWMLRAMTYVLGALSVQVLAYYAVGEYKIIFDPLVTACWAFVIAALVGKVLQNLREFGFPIPAFMGEKPKAETTATP